MSQRMSFVKMLYFPTPYLECISKMKEKKAKKPFNIIVLYLLVKNPEKNFCASPIQNPFFIVKTKTKMNPYKKTIFLLKIKWHSLSKTTV